MLRSKLRPKNTKIQAKLSTAPAIKRFRFDRIFRERSIQKTLAVYRLAGKLISGAYIELSYLKYADMLIYLLN